MAIRNLSILSILPAMLAMSAGAAPVNPCNPGSPVTGLQVCLTVDGASTDFTPFVQPLGDGFQFDTSFLGLPGFFEIPGELRIFSMAVLQSQPALVDRGTIYTLRPSIFVEDLGAPSTISIFAARPLPVTDPFDRAFSEFTTSAAGSPSAGAVMTPAGSNIMTVFGLPADLTLGVDTGAGCSAPAGGFNTCASLPLESYFTAASLDALVLEMRFSMSGNGALGGAFGMAGVQTPEPATALLFAPALALLALRRTQARGRV